MKRGTVMPRKAKDYGIGPCRRCSNPARMVKTQLCGTCYERERAEDPEYRAQRAANQVAYRRRLRHETIEALGGECACCGESQFEFLAVDHINGGGTEHRATVGTSHMFDLALKAEGYPRDKYRVLCHNCNSALGFYGSCPHRGLDDV